MSLTFLGLFTGTLTLAAAASIAYQDNSTNFVPPFLLENLSWDLVHKMLQMTMQNLTSLMLLQRFPAFLPTYSSELLVLLQ